MACLFAVVCWQVVPFCLKKMSGAKEKCVSLSPRSFSVVILA